MTNLDLSPAAQSGAKTRQPGQRKQFSLFRAYKYYVADSNYIVKNYGFKTLLGLRGTGFLVFTIFLNLVQHSILYVIIPFFIAKGLL